MPQGEVGPTMLAELPPDIAASPLCNNDLAPTPASRRTWTTYNFAALWIAMAPRRSRFGRRSS